MRHILIFPHNIIKKMVQVAVLNADSLVISTKIPTALVACLPAGKGRSHQPERGKIVIPAIQIAHSSLTSTT
jgi:hypothetical protein